MSQGVVYVKPNAGCSATVMTEEVFQSLIGFNPERDMRISTRRIYSPDTTDLDTRTLSSAGIRIHPTLFKGAPHEGIERYRPSLCANAQGVRPDKSITRFFTSQRDSRNARTIYFIQGNDAIVLDKHTNQDLLALNKSLKKGYFGNTVLMTQLAHLHAETFGGTPPTYVDLFLGGGGGMVAAYNLGSRKIVGVDIKFGNLTTASRNMQIYFDALGIEFEHSGSNQEMHYKVDSPSGDVAITLLRANSMQLQPRDFEYLGIAGADVISDIPWGPVKCHAYGEQGVIRSEGEMMELSRNLEDTITRMGSSHVTLAKNTRTPIDLPSIREFRVTPLYNICQYAP